MARRSPVEVDARRLALRDLLATRKYRGDKDAVELLTSSAADLAQEAAYELNAGRVPEARRYARAHQLIAESRRRLVARHQREIDAQREREAAEHGIRAGETVRVVSLRPDGDVPVGTVVTVGRVSGSALFVDHDGKSSLVWGRDVERVEPTDKVVVRDPAGHGIRPGHVVRVTRTFPSNQVPLGTVCTVKSVRNHQLFVEHDGQLHCVWDRDVERAEPETEVTR